jgi:hypothetical protein
MLYIQQLVCITRLSLLVASSPILPTASQHKRMTYTSLLYIQSGTS